MEMFRTTDQLLNLVGYIDPTTNEWKLRTSAKLEGGDIQLGAVEIKDGVTDTRVRVDADQSLQTVLDDKTVAKLVTYQSEQYGTTDLSISPLNQEFAFPNIFLLESIYISFSNDVNRDVQVYLKTPRSQIELVEIWNTDNLNHKELNIAAYDLHLECHSTYRIILKVTQKALNGYIQSGVGLIGLIQITDTTNKLSLSINGGSSQQLTIPTGNFASVKQLALVLDYELTKAGIAAKAEVRDENKIRIYSLLTGLSSTVTLGTLDNSLAPLLKMDSASTPILNDGSPKTCICNWNVIFEVAT